MQNAGAFRHAASPEIFSRSMNPAEFANIARSEQRFWWYRGMNQILFELLDPIARERKFKRVLEAGCGTGYLAKLLGERYRWPMVPVDLGWEGLELRQVDEHRSADTSRYRASAFPDAAFDAVLSMDVIVHFPRGEEHAAVQEIVRVLEARWIALHSRLGARRLAQPPFAVCA